MKSGARQEEIVERKTPGDEPIQISIGVLTFKRPALLRACVVSLFHQSLLANPAYQVSIIVVDNDAGGSARATVDDLVLESPISIRYAVEGERGVVSGRNRVFQEAIGCDFLAFLDDDETAAPDWLYNLLQAQQNYSADVVTGPVDAEVESPAPWLVEGAFFAARLDITGTSPRYVETNNVLLTGEIVRTRRFDPRFNLVGGEDTHFFYQLKREGYRLVWCESARVKETIPPARATPEWLVNRAYSNAYRLTETLLCVESTGRAVGNRFLRAIVSLGIGICLYAVSFGSVARNVRARRRIARFRGTLDALKGRERTYYQNGVLLT